MARIEIWTRDVVGTQKMHPYSPQHTFLIKVNDDGTREILRGGPVDDNMLIGNVVIINSAYDANSGKSGDSIDTKFGITLPQFSIYTQH